MWWFCVIVKTTTVFGGGNIVLTRTHRVVKLDIHASRQLASELDAAERVVVECGASPDTHLDFPHFATLKAAGAL